MSDHASDGVGWRVRRTRKLLGLTQVALAARMNVSESLLKKVERGVAPASPSFTAAAARALGVTTYDLHGQPEPRFGEERRDIATLETAVLAGEDLIGVDDDEPLDGLALPYASQVDAVAALKRRADYARCAEKIPPLLQGLHLAVVCRERHQRERAAELLARTYQYASITLYRLGSPLAGLAAERAVQASIASGDPVLLALTQGERALSLMHRGAYDVATRVTAQALTDLPAIDEPDRDDTIRGFLHLRLAILAARRGDAPTSRLHLREAADHATRLPDGSDVLGTAFCTSNVMIHEVAAHVEMGDGTSALTFERPLPPGLLPSRQGHHYVDLARAWLLHGNREKTIDCLMTARRIAPQLTRYHPQVHETLAVLAENDRRRSDSLAGLARWAGVKM